MEDLSNSEQLEDNSQPDLLERFADKEVTIFGIPGTFKILADMCPIDLNDPMISRETKNEFVVKAANEGGLEIEQEYESLFSRITEQNGLEKKFTIVEHTENPSTSKEPDIQHSPVQNRLTNAAKRETREERITANPIVSSERAAAIQAERLKHSHHIEYETAIFSSSSSSNSLTSANKLKQPDVQTAKAINANEAGEDTNRKGFGSRVSTEPIISRRLEQLVTDEQMNVIAIDVTGSTENNMFVHDESDSHLVNSIDNKVLEISQTDPFFEPLPITTLEKPKMIKVGWVETLSKEPLEVYEDFAETLRLFVELPVLPVLDSEENPLTGTTLPNLAETDEQPPMHPIIAKVIEQLTELDPKKKELVAPILKDFVGALHGIKVLEARNADFDTISVAKDQLEGLCLSLFEAIGIDADDQDIKRFIETVLRPEFSPMKTADKELNLYQEHTGTREAKWRNARDTGNQADIIDGQFQHVLGMIALFYVRHTDNSYIAA